MRRSTAITSLLATAVAVACATAFLAPAQAAEPTASAKDARGDVKIYGTQYKSVSPAERRSIDIRNMTITPRTDRTVRFSVTIKKALRIRNAEQMVFFSLTPVASSSGDWVTADYGWSPQKPRKWSYASVDLGGYEYANCVAKRIRTDRATGTLSADIPDHCVPTGPAKVTVSTVVGQFRTDADPYSRDMLKIRGAQTIWEA